jgi:FKBP-type peptidyl-prolyl cis-trans isomerase
MESKIYKEPILEKTWAKISLALLAVVFIFGLITFYNVKNHLKNNTTMDNIIKKDNGLVIEDKVRGDGQEIKPGDEVTMHYTGTLEDGTVFDSSVERNQPFKFQVGVGQVIQGWEEGVPGMKVGGKRKLTIPSKLAYGDQGVPGAIPGGATLIFEIEALGTKSK